jgi:NADH:ubiquinone oxidoreductase subunit C
MTMDQERLTQALSGMFPDCEIASTPEETTIKARPESWHGVALRLRHDEELQFDYLHNLYAIDWQTHFTVVCHLESTIFRHQLTLRVDLANHDHAELDTLSDIWITAEYQEREVYDLMGIRFLNHPDPRRLFLDEGWGFPLRKDYQDDINFIER